MDSVMPNEITFKEIERSFFEIGCEVAKMLIKKFLEEFDYELADHEINQNCGTWAKKL